MKKTLPEISSEFGKATLALDQQLEKFNSCTNQLARLELETDKGYEKAISLVTEIEKTRESLQKEMLVFSEALKKARSVNESNEALIASLMPKITTRQETATRLLERFKLFGSMITKLNKSISIFKEQTSEKISDIERQQMAVQLQEVDAKLEALATEASQLVEDARNSKMRTMELEADSLKKSLSSSRNKLRLLFSKH